ncbi:MAG: [FeFe] hydrogenase H-cluster maturation GTPase HydF [Bacteroidales bacterium]|nr:[FeFe] hydrogenase H-cluster maturation GTPase HydF [Bacteroidales bacterium]
MEKGRESKPHIGIYGRRNYGKSSLINCITGQDVAIVSDIAGTTTDPVKRSYEILSVGPVIFIDTAGIDDTGELGEKRIKKTLDTISTIDLALLVITNNEFGHFEEILINEFDKFDVPYLIIYNKNDIYPCNDEFLSMVKNKTGKEVILFSTKFPNNVNYIIQKIKDTIPENAYNKPTLLGDIINKNDIVLLIVPIDTEAPEGRLILPQVQVIRDVLDNFAVAIVLKETEVENFLKTTTIKPKLAITDSQIFSKANSLVPSNIMLTSFSIVLARHKGPFKEYIKGTPHISNLKDNDNILLLESCSHQITCDDIGRYKIPKWLSQFTGKKLNFDIVARLENIPKPITQYAMVIQCGGCMITRKQLYNRLKPAIDNGIPISNYGLTIAYINGIFNRAIQPFTKNLE